MKKYFLAPIFLALLLFFGTVTVPFAKAAKSEMPEVEALAATPQPVNSFELFWPIAPGKVMGDSLYSLKILKEKIRGFFIFGAPQKADYDVFLATKRILEVELLLKNGKADLANKTLDVFSDKLNAASVIWDKIKKEGGAPVSVKDNVRKELTNLSTFLKFLSSKNTGDIKAKIDQNLDRVNKLLNSL